MKSYEEFREEYYGCYRFGWERDIRTDEVCLYFPDEPKGENKMVVHENGCLPNSFYITVHVPRLFELEGFNEIDGVYYVDDEVYNNLGAMIDTAYEFIGDLDYEVEHAYREYLDYRKYLEELSMFRNSKSD